jgi:hypothetical protein
VGSDNHETLREVLDRVLNKIGPTFKQTVYDELERAGIHLDCPYSSLKEVEKALENIFGPDGTSLLMNRIRKERQNNAPQ